MEAIRRVSSTQSKDLRKKALEVFALMDDWIGTRYKAEIECAKDLVLLIKDAIEKQRRLPNLIYVENEKLMLDYSTLVYKPEDPPRPDSPVEKNGKFQIKIRPRKLFGNSIKKPRFSTESNSPTRNYFFTGNGRVFGKGCNVTNILRSIA